MHALPGIGSSYSFGYLTSKASLLSLKISLCRFPRPVEAVLYCLGRLGVQGLEVQETLNPKPYTLNPKP